MARARSNDGEINTDGYYYQLYTLLHCIYRLRKNKIVCEYEIGNAVIGFGALDDVVFTATLESGEKITTAVQVKHSNAKNMIDERYLCQNPKTCLYKYLKSFMEIKETISLKQLGPLILWTNMPISATIANWFEQFALDSDESDILGDGIDDGLFYERYRVKSDQWQQIIELCKNYETKENERNAARQKSVKHIKEPTDDDWEQFLSRFVFYVKAPKVAKLKANLVSNIGSISDDLCKLVESFAVKKIATSDQINRLYALLNLRNSVENGPYTKLIFNNLDELQCKVMQLFENETCNVLRVKASQDVDCTIARLISIVEKCLASESKCYIALSYEALIENRDILQLIIEDPTLIEIALKCIVVSSITEDEIHSIEKNLSTLKVIFIGNQLESNIDDKFDISKLNSLNKNVIKNKKIKLSNQQTATVNDIFGKELFQKENYTIVLEMYKLSKDSILQVTVDEPKLNDHYLSRTTKWSSEDNNTTNADLLNQTDFCKVIVYAQPGMGKSTEMIKLASDFRVKNQDHLVIYLHCRTAVSKWRDSVEDWLCNSVISCSKLTRLVVKKVIQLGKVILILDGYDEVSQDYKRTLQSLVSKIARVKIFKLYIATRPQCKDEIKNILGSCGLCYFEPFSKLDQMIYLNTFWNSGNGLSLKAKDTNIVTIKNLLSMINENSNVKRRSENECSFIGTPLQTHMIAVIYKDRIASRGFIYIEEDIQEFMYKEFAEFKFMESVKRHYDPSNATHSQIIKVLRESFLHDHVVAAVQISLNKPQPEIELLCERIQHYGIVSSSGFLHFTYMEYFLALYLLTYSVEISKMEYYINRFIYGYDIPVLRFMNYLLNHMDPSVKPKHSLYESVTNEHPSGYIPPPISSRLHPDKMKEFHNALCKIDADEIDVLFSYLIRRRMANMTEVIYDCLRVEIKSKT